MLDVQRSRIAGQGRHCVTTLQCLGDQQATVRRFVFTYGDLISGKTGLVQKKVTLYQSSAGISGSPAAPPSQVPLAISATPLFFVCDSKVAGLGGIEKGTGLLNIFGCHENFNRAQTVNRQPVSVSQRFTANGDMNTGRFEKRADLLRVYFPIRHKHPLHETAPSHYCRWPAGVRLWRPDG
jgi:hypothetical protein